MRIPTPLERMNQMSFANNGHRRTLPEEIALEKDPENLKEVKNRYLFFGATGVALSGLSVVAILNPPSMDFEISAVDETTSTVLEGVLELSAQVLYTGFIAAIGTTAVCAGLEAAKLYKSARNRLNVLPSPTE